MLRLLCLILLFSINTIAGDFNRMFPRIIKVEGETFTRIKFDAGGATKYGITILTYTYWCNGRKIVVVVCDKDGDGKITPKDLNKTTIEDVKPIYQENYWNVAKGNEIKSQAIAEFITDFFINSGASGRNVRMIQKVVGVSQDGHFGKKTVEAINNQNHKRLFSKLYSFRTNFYIKIVKSNPSQKKFLRGWKNRLITLKKSYQDEKLL